MPENIKFCKNLHTFHNDNRLLDFTFFNYLLQRFCMYLLMSICVYMYVYVMSICLFAAVVLRFQATNLDQEKAHNFEMVDIVFVRPYDQQVLH